VEGERFPAHRAVLAARSEYFRGLLLSGMQEGARGAGGGGREIKLGEVSARAFRVVLRYLYTGEVPSAGEEAESESKQGTRGKEVKGGKGDRRANGAKGGSAGKGKEAKGGKGKEAEDREEEKVVSAEEARRDVEREVLKAADLFQAEGLLKHSLAAFEKGLTVKTAVEGLVWAHLEGPEAARQIATEFVVANGRRIQV
jgi:hypothetical protein